MCNAVTPTGVKKTRTNRVYRQGNWRINRFEDSQRGLFEKAIGITSVGLPCLIRPSKTRGEVTNVDAVDGVRDRGYETDQNGSPSLGWAID